MTQWTTALRFLCPWDFRILEWVAISSSRDLPDPGTKPMSPAMPADSREAPKSMVLLCSQIAIVLDGSCLRLQKMCVESVVVIFFLNHHKDKWGGGACRNV